MRNLAWNSQISGRFTYSTTENDIPLLQQMLHTGGVFVPITANTTVFNGDQEKHDHLISVDGQSAAWLGLEGLLQLLQTGKRFKPR